MKKSIEVQILGQRIRVRHEDESYIRKLETFINEKIRMHEGGGKGGTGLDAALRGMITLADEFFSLLGEKEQLEKRIEDKARKLIDLIDEKAVLTEDG